MATSVRIKSCRIRPDHLLKKTLGQVLKERRALLRLTQRELALKFGVKPSHVAYLETNRRRHRWDC